MSAIPEITGSELITLRSRGEVRLIDVRSESEVAAGVIAGAEHIPMHLIPTRVQELGADTPTVFYCHSGARSGQVTAFLMQNGVSGVMNLQGGVIAWIGSGQSLTALA